MFFRKIMFFLIKIILLFKSSLSLSIYPKFNKEFYRKPYNLHNEIKILNNQQVDLITNNWRQNIINHLRLSHYENIDFKRFDSNYYYIPDEVDNTDQEIILNKLLLLDKFLDNNKQEYMFIGWTPTEKNSDTNKFLLQLVLLSPDYHQKKINIIQIIDSPFWDSDQISSLELKESLEQFIKTYKKFNYFSIDYNNLYQQNLRYKLEWRDLPL